jgi:4-amino-4-deoxy-L-arabinose transferase-like glycosyltransferase
MATRRLSDRATIPGQTSAMREESVVRRAPLLVLLLATAPLYLWGLGAVGFQDPDEGMYAQIAREMLASGDWIVPTFNGVAYIEKPPLMFWLTAGTFAALGPSEYTARLWKVLPVLGTVVATHAIGARLASPRVGIAGAAVLATTMGAFLFSRISVMDPLLALGVALACYGVALAGARRRGADLWFWTGVAVGVMSKGLPGLVFPAGLLGVWAAASRDPGVVRAAVTRRGILVASVAVLPWHALTAWRVPGFFRFYVVDNQILRFLGARAYAEDGTPLGTLAFLGVTAVALFPWTPLLAAAIGSAMRAGAREPGRRFLLGWLALVVGLFAGSSFKLEYYALPAFPAAALLVAFAVCEARDQAPRAGARGDSSRAVRSRLRRWAWVGLIGGAAFTLAVTWAWSGGYVTPAAVIRGLSVWSTNYRIVLEQGLPPPAVAEERLAAALVLGGVLWTVGFGVAVWCLCRRAVPQAAAAIACLGVGLCLVASLVLGEVGPHHSLKPLAERLAALLRSDDVLIHERGLEKGGGLLFYTGRRVLVLNGRRGDLEFGSTLPGASERFIDTRRFRELWSGDARVFLVTDLPAPRSAIAEASPDVPAPLASTGTRWLYANRRVE